MIAAQEPVQRPLDARLLVVDSRGRITETPRTRWLDLMHAGDLVIANDAATIPASLHGVHLATGAAIEVRLAGFTSQAKGATVGPIDVRRFAAVVFGEGDFRTRTEDRPLPPPLKTGDHLAFGDLSASIEALLDHPRFVSIRFAGSSAGIWEGIARRGRPIQYAHVTAPLALWDVWTPIAALPVAFEPPSAGFVLDWKMIRAIRERGIKFATITLAAGISSTGDAELDRRLPLDEPYWIPEATALAVRTRAAGARVVAIGTTVVRALEHSAAVHGMVRAGDGLADQRVGHGSRLRVVDAIISGTHEPDSSHYQLLRAFADDETLVRVSAALESGAFRTHEFGDSVLIESARQSVCGSSHSRKRRDDLVATAA